MKATLLVSTCLLCAIGTSPVAANPALEIAPVVSQALIQPVYMSTAGPGQVQLSLQEVIDLESEIARNARRKPGRTTFANIVLERGIMEAVEASLTKDEVLDQALFAKSLAKYCVLNSGDLAYFAAIGWELTEKRAASKLASVGKSPEFEAVHDAVLAILIGLEEETLTLTFEGAEDVQAIQKEAKVKWIEIQGWD